MDAADELLKIADEAAAASRGAGLASDMEALQTAATEVGKAWSGSPLGYHADVYYEGLKVPRAGDLFSQEWGLMDRYTNTTSNYRVYSPDVVKAHILKVAGEPDLAAGRRKLAQSSRSLEGMKAQVHSILSLAIEEADDGYLKAKLKELDGVRVLTEATCADVMTPSGNFISRDMQALNAGRRVAPHLQLLSLPYALTTAKVAFDELSSLARQTGSHLQRRSRSARRSALVGTNVFIGHGRSPVWRDLKDFISERLKLPYDEFNRVPVAGVTNIVRLSEMLDDAAIAFIVMTAEDERADGGTQPRMNVVHEAGLFQGRLGFTKAIILLEEDCKDFSNIDGLGQIRFPKGDIKHVFEEIRRVLEREGLVKPA
jgi:predicted nucleotide-binding protein